MIYQPNPPLNFRPESEIRAKKILLHKKSKIRGQKRINTQSAAFAGSANLLKFRPYFEIFKIRRSVGLLTLPSPHPL